MTTGPEFALADHAMAHLDRILDSLAPADLDRQSPCAEWRVRDVLAHLAGTVAALADFARTGRRELPEDIVPLKDPIGDTKQAVRALRAVLESAPSHAQQAAGDVAIECTTHAWDLDPEINIPENLAADVLAFVAPLITPELRQQFFGPQIPLGAGAGPGDRLLALLGRDPGKIALRPA